jgi:hypothetical protein
MINDLKKRLCFKGCKGDTNLRLSFLCLILKQCKILRGVRIGKNDLITKGLRLMPSFIIPMAAHTIGKNDLITKGLRQADWGRAKLTN